MSKNTLLFLVTLTGFLGLITWALLQEIQRNEKEIQAGISGVIQVAPELLHDVVKTDNAHVLLFAPDRPELVAMVPLNPFVPPLTFYIGQEHALKAQPLHGAYRLLVVTDKDGQLENPVAGEVIGPLTAPLPLGTEEYEYTADQPFQGLPAELQTVAPVAEDPALTIQGTMTVAPTLKDQVAPTDRVVVMLFDSQQGRPVAIKIIPHFYDSQPFSIGAADAMGGQPLHGAYSLRILTDKNNQPFQAAPGEIIGRSKDPVPLGTQGISFVLDTPYIR